jgi:hypothetical protein
MYVRFNSKRTPSWHCTLDSLNAHDAAYNTFDHSSRNIVVLVVALYGLKIEWLRVSDPAVSWPRTHSLDAIPPASATLRRTFLNYR